MKLKSIFYHLLSLLMMAILIAAIPAHSQERKDTNKSKNIFLELGGSGTALTGNYDFRFSKGRSDGLGMRIGIGRMSYESEPWFGEGWTKGRMFSLPLEVNYILGKRRFSFEMGYALTYVSASESSKYRLFSNKYTYSEDSGNFLTSYVPVGFRFKPKTNGLMLKFNLGPMFNFSAPNLLYHEKITPWIGLAMGYSFY